MINEPCNPSRHNVNSMPICTTEYKHVTHNNCAYKQGSKSTIKWYKEDSGHIVIICYLIIIDHV